MAANFDVIVLGLGAAGSSALYHLSKTGKKVCGIDQFAPPHSFGSSHGQSRIIRQAYHEHPQYVPLVKQAYMLWDELEKAWGRQLFRQTGGIMLGNAHSGVVTGAELSARSHDIPYEYLNNKDIRKRFPAFKPDDDTVGVLEKQAGILFPEECVKANLTLADSNGADVKTNERVTAVAPDANGVTVTTTHRKYTADKLIVSAGAWLGNLLPDLQLPLTVERQVLFWFKAQQTQLALGELPIYIWEYEAGKIFYGFPDLGDGIKVAHHHAGRVIKPAELVNDVDGKEVDAMTEVVKRHFNIVPGFNYATTCMYTNTPDEHFIIDRHPQHSNIIIVSPCSGHGFKFASIMGKIFSDMALENKLDFDISMFGIGRPALV